MPKIKATLLMGVNPDPATLQKIEESMGIQTGQRLEFMVFEVAYGGNKYYCCWSGGELRNGEPHMTLIGLAAVEALSNLPIGNGDALIIQELKLGATPLRSKVIATLKRATPNSKICFLGDMQGELDGLMAEAFNLQHGAINISQM